MTLRTHKQSQDLPSLFTRMYMLVMTKSVDGREYCVQNAILDAVARVLLACCP